MGKITKTHQNILLNGIDVGDNPARKYSKFCNEGKWGTFIKPLLPKDPQDMTFFEYGSNAGMYLRLAKEYGFRNVWGLERNEDDCQVAALYRGSLKLDYKILNLSIEEDFNFDDLPLSDVSLLANFHYHLQVPVLKKLLDALETKTCSCIVVSVNSLRPRDWMASGEQESVLSYFRQWWKQGEITNVDLENDPHPRKMFSYLFSSPKIFRIPLHDIKTRNPHHERTNIAVNDFICHCLTDKNLDVRKTYYYNLEFRRTHHKRSEEEIYQRVEHRRSTILDIMKNGIKDPLIINSDHFILDGNFRYKLLKILGLQSAIVRIL